MEQLIRAVICKYAEYMAEAKLYKKWLSQGEDPETKSHLALLEVKIAVIDAWMLLLSADEKFVVDKHLIEQLEWPRVVFEYRERWKREFERTERTLQIYQASALAKIADFTKRHRDMTIKIFYDMMDSDEIE